MAIVLDIQIGGKNTEQQLASAQKSFDRMEDAVSRLASMFSQMAGDSRTIAQNMGRVSGGGGGGQRTGGGRGGAPPVQRFTRGPAQRLMDLQQQRQAVSNITDPAQRSAVLQDIQRAEFLARRSITLQRRRNADPDALNRPGLLELFETLNRRIGGLGGRGGLGGLLRSFGGGAAGGAAGGAGGAAAVVGPLVVALAAVTLVVKAWTAAIKTAIDVGQKAGRGAALTGGTVGQFESIQGLAAFLGTDAVSLARSVSAGTKTGVGGAVGAGIGISPLPRAFDPQSDAEKTRLLVDAITKSSASDARFIARATGQEDLLQLRNLTPESLKELQGAFAEMASPELVKGSAELRKELVMLQAAFQKLATSDVVLGLIRGLTMILDGITVFVNGIADVFDKFPFMAALLGLPGTFGHALGGGRGNKSINELETESRKAMVDSMDRWARAAKEHGEILGGDARARRALPPGAGENLAFGGGLGQDAVRDLQLGLL